MHDRGYAIGQKIGNYQLIAKIGSGAYSSVYQGRHYIFEGGPVVALKLLYADINSPEQQKEFVQEARICISSSIRIFYPLLMQASLRTYPIW